MSLKNIKWSNFHSPWNNQKTVGFLMISGEEGGVGGGGGGGGGGGVQVNQFD